MNPTDFLIIGVLFCCLVTALFFIWTEFVARDRSLDSWCSICKRYVGFWCSHVYSKEHKENLSKVRGNNPKVKSSVRRE